MEQGVDWIKLFITGGILDAKEGTDKPELKMSLEMAKATCKKAHVLGLKVAAHVKGKEGVKLALEAGVDTIEHGSSIDEEILALYRRNKAAMVVTISPTIAIAKLPLKCTKMTNSKQQLSKIVMEDMLEGAKVALKEDIPVGIGTDSACPYVTHYDMWREVYYFSKYCKVSNQFALYTATLGNAQIIGLQDEIGSIEVGKCADLIVVKDNPLEELRNLAHVEMVIARGNLIENQKIKHIKKIDKMLDEFME